MKPYIVECTMEEWSTIVTALRKEWIRNHEAHNEFACQLIDEALAKMNAALDQQ